MAIKHKLTSDFEKQTFDSKMLKKLWVETYHIAEKLTEAKWTNHHLSVFIQWINGNGYSSEFFPGFSLGTLLISKPNNGKLNYQQTLSVKYDKQTDLYTMKYSDWDKIESENDYEKAILWKRNCPGIELSRLFLEFLNWNKNWLQHNL